MFQHSKLCKAAAIASYILEASPAPATAPAPAPASKAAKGVKTAKAVKASAAPAGAEGEQPLSKSALKKLAKGKGKKKEKPQWGDGSSKKEKDKEKAKAIEVPKFVNKTPKGEKKDIVSDPMEAAYYPSAVESAWQDWWEAKGYYTCDPKDAIGKNPADDKFVMVIPPPNVTGSLHLGHALTAAVEDTITRWHRMSGHATLYVPGENCYFVE